LNCFQVRADGAQVGAERESIENHFLGGASVDDVVKIFPSWSRQEIESIQHEMSGFLWYTAEEMDYFERGRKQYG